MAWVRHTTSIGRSIGCRRFLPGWWCWWCWCWVGATINMNMAGTLRKINRRDVCRGYNWKRNEYGLVWLKLIELQKDNWKIKYDWLWVPFFFCTFLWWLHHGISCVVWRTTTRENLCYITLRSGTWDGDDRSETSSEAAFGKLPSPCLGEDTASCCAP